MIEKLSPQERYWVEALEYAFDSINLSDILTKEQLQTVGKSLSVSAENQSMAFGSECIPHPSENRIKDLEKIIKNISSEKDEIAYDFKKNVARRHNVDVSQVILEKDGNATVRV